MSTGKFTYDIFDEPSDHIRLVKVLPRQGRKKLRLQLEHAPFHKEDCQYEAISYMWGPETPKRAILVNGKILRVRDNIWRCLKHLRDNDLTSSKLWIDAICINQDDNTEKNKQVARMCKIFRQASKVLIWLGSTSMQTYLHDDPSKSLQHRLEDVPAKDVDAHIDLIGHSDPRHLSLENQIMSIVYNPYWRRLWIVQEVTLAREACIVFGKALLQQERFFSIYQTARENSKPGFQDWIKQQTDPSIENLGTDILDHHPILRVQRTTRPAQSAHQTEPLSELIRNCQRQICTDPRDYVYGLIGLLDTCPRITVDYALAREEVLFQALQHLDYEAHRTRKMRKCRLGTDLFAAAALTKALSVTASSYLQFEQTLDSQKVQAMRESTLRFSLSFFSLLTTIESEAWTENTSYEHVYHLHVSGCRTKTVHQMRREEKLSIKRLNGQITQFACASRSSLVREEMDRYDVVQCYLHVGPILLLQRDPKDDRMVAIRQFIWPDTTRQLHEASLWLEMQLPRLLRAALQREINTCGLEWDDMRSVKPTSILRLSVFETISLCNLINI